MAKIAGVSKSTVSRALNDSYGISGRTREKVLKAAEELKYRVNPSARSLRSKSDSTIGVLFAKEWGDRVVTAPGHTRKIAGILRRCNELGYDILMFAEDLSDNARLMRIIKEKGLSGILILDMVDLSVLKALNSYGVPFVLVNWYWPGYGQQCFVRTDMQKAVEIAVDLFVEKGHRDIGLINWLDNLTHENIIGNAFKNRMQHHNIPCEADILNRGFEFSDGDLAEYLDDGRKRAYLCFSYHTSVGILKYCGRNGISVPEELSLISFDFFPFFDYTSPSLTGIMQKYELMGERAVQLLDGMIYNRQKAVGEFIAPEIILRESC